MQYETKTHKIHRDEKKIVIVYRPVRNNQQAIRKTNGTDYGLTEGGGTKKQTSS